MKKFILPIILIALCYSSVFSQNTCATAIALTQASVPFASGAQTTCGKVGDYGIPVAACLPAGTAYGNGEDFVYSFNITTAPMAYNLSLGGAGTWKSCIIYNGCPAPAGAPSNCLGGMFTGAGSSASGNFIFPTNGTYYIVIDTWPNPACTSFTLGINPLPACPGGLGTGVTNIASLPYASGPGTTCGSVNDISATSFAVSCGYSQWYTGEDAIWTFTPATSGVVEINLTSAGSWPGLTLYKNCPFSGSTVCEGHVMNSTANIGLSACVQAGQVYYLMMDSWAAPSCNAYTNITITAPITGFSTNDYCSTPILLTAGGTFTGTTNSMTADNPGNYINTFCGSTENNQWFTFVATAATATFGFSGIGGSNCPQGVQAQVFNVGLSSAVCANACTSFTSMSTPCYNPATLAGGTLTATGLTIGQTYYLVVDGNAGSQCTFNINGWTNPVLPVDMIYFKGKNIESNMNELEWMVAQEERLDYYLVQRSVDGKNFKDLDKVKPAGQNNVEKTYNYTDVNFPGTINYYRLKIIDNDGAFRYSSMVAINTDKTNKFKVNKIFPNPANTEIYMSVDVPTDGELEYEVLDITGRVVIKNNKTMSMGTDLLKVDLEGLNKGIYYLKFNCNNETKVEKFSLQ